MRAAGFQLLLEEGRPIEVEEWAAAAGIDSAALREMLKSPTVEGRVQLDDDGRLLGIAGLTVEPSRHQLDIGGTIRWTWCALDAVGILGALGSTRDYLVEKWFRDSRITDIYEGTGEIQRLIIARHILDYSAADLS